jgi:hypothetical protein
MNIKGILPPFPRQTDYEREREREREHKTCNVYSINPHVSGPLYECGAGH